MNGFIRADGARLVDDNGPRLMRGIGLGNWLVPEGYMWGLPAATNSPRQIEALTAAILGWDAAQQFWSAWRAAYVTNIDLAAIREAGFDHVRLPLNWRLLCRADGRLLPDGLAGLDAFVAACARHGLRIVLDLHAAPGGQTGTNIDDSAGLPELFLDPHWQHLTVQLWTAIATRYANEPAVLAYDLLNEPLPYHWADTFASDLIGLYRRITAAVREVDSNHLIMYEGTRWATDFAAFTELLDDNSALQFHKYWSRPDEESLEPVTSVAGRLGVPLYMGEGGENTHDWNATATALYERLGISWSAWPYKAIGRTTAICNLPQPDNWSSVVEYATRPEEQTRQRAAEALRQLQASLTTRPDLLNQELINALMRRAPVRLPAGAYSAIHGDVTLSWPTSFDFDRARGADAPMDVSARLGRGAALEFTVFSETNSVQAIPPQSGVDITVERHDAGSQLVRVTADEGATFTAVSF